MIIVSQDKEVIVNFDNVQAINVHMQNKKQVAAWFSCNENNRNNVLLGNYETEERAKEVIKEIARFYRMYKGMENCNRDIQVMIAEQIEKDGQDLYVYKMPED